jgi:phage head maturation protease
VRGDVTGSSFQFAVIDDMWSMDGSGILLREIRSAHLFELGPVVWPAYLASTATYRSLERFNVERAKTQAPAVVFPTPEQIQLLNQFRLAELA